MLGTIIMTVKADDIVSLGEITCSAKSTRCYFRYRDVFLQVQSGTNAREEYSRRCGDYCISYVLSYSDTNVAISEHCISLETIRPNSPEVAVMKSETGMSSTSKLKMKVTISRCFVISSEQQIQTS